MYSTRSHASICVSIKHVKNRGNFVSSHLVQLIILDHVENRVLKFCKFAGSAVFNRIHNKINEATGVPIKFGVLDLINHRNKG